MLQVGETLATKLAVNVERSQPHVERIPLVLSGSDTRQDLKVKRLFSFDKVSWLVAQWQTEAAAAILCGEKNASNTGDQVKGQRFVTSLTRSITTNMTFHSCT